ncbi:nucleoside deaminase [Brumimicrobium oceani]|uniref:Nucleoside deaminase n=1 Tax=Brumimicrobium oceani TaxID=2100725 RepID=A0A2U2XB59_9FLAO|nr:nucleoside deaminase [Brumimicrobium oceani]PWH85034.1 nucleoside deaminase [Brumimicrobium oceani]
MKLFYATLVFIFVNGIAFGQSENERQQNKNHKQKAMSENNTETVFTETDIKFLRHCLVLAEEALQAGDQAFGSILVNADNEIIAEARNRINEKNVFAHPEIELAEWALENLTLEERRESIMYTTGEHCPMCAGAHAWSQIGGLYYLSSAKQLQQWLNEFGVDEAPIVFIPAEEILKNVTIKGPAEGALLEEIKQKHKRYFTE